MPLPRLTKDRFSAEPSTRLSRSFDPGAHILKITDIEVIKWNPGAGKNFVYVKLSTDAGITQMLDLSTFYTYDSLAVD